MNQTPNNISVKDSSIEALIGQIADEFAARLARGERAQIEEYTAQYPEHAKIIEQVLRSVAVMQNLDLQPVSDVSGGNQAAHRQLGDFHIVREIGRGGMGTVYEAQQLSMDRRVALKVLPFAALLDDRQLLRFKNEARTAGTLHHPHIVPVYSVGVERGVHFYAMQYIEGPSLAEVLIDLLADEADSARDNSSASTDLPPTTDSTEGARTSPVAESPESEANSIIDTRRELQALLSTARSSSRREYFEMVARWGIQACEALAHAHEGGVLHRDIKPGNLLIDERGELWVTDFGLARLEQDASMTASGDIVGTLRYMAPEQALGKRVLIDHRADIYSLGVTLYELLSLQPAFSEEDREALLHAVAFDEPTALRKHDARIPVDLETIVLKTLEKRPEDRYLAAEELAEDLNRFLKNKPIQAKPASLWQRCAKWSRRHVAVVWSLVFVLLTVGVVMAVAIAAVMSERSKVLQEQAKTEMALERAEVSAQLAKDAVDDMYVNFADEWIRSQVGLSDVERSFLEKAAAFYAQMPIDLEASPAAQVSAAKTLRRLSGVRGKLGQIDEAKDSIQQAIAILESLHADSPSRTINSRLELAECYLSLDDIEGPPQSDTFDSAHKAVKEFEQLLAERPDDDELGARLGVAKSKLAQHHHLLQEYDEADRLYSEAHAQLQQIVDSSPDNLKFLWYLSSVVRSRAISNFIIDENSVSRGIRRGRRDEARRLYLLRVELVERLSDKAPNDLRFRVAAACRGLEATYFLDDLEHAIKMLRKSEEDLKELVQLNPTRSDLKRRLRMVYHQLGNVFSALGRHEEAVEVLKLDIALRAQLEPRSQLTVSQMASHAFDYRKLTHSLTAIERWQEARETNQAAISLGRQAFEAGGSDGKPLLQDLQQLAQICRQLDDEQAAKTAELDRQELINRSISELSRGIAKEPTVLAHFERAGLFEQTGRPEKAMADYAKCLDYEPIRYSVYVKRALMLWGLSRYEEALEEIEKALNVPKIDDQEQLLQAFHSDIRVRPNDDHELYGMRGTLLCLLGRDKDALQSLNAALQGKWCVTHSSIDQRILVRLLTVGAPEVRNPERALELANQMLEMQRNHNSLKAAGFALYRLGRYEEARDTLQEASDCGRLPDDSLEWTWIMLAMTKERLGEHEEARNLFSKATKRFSDRSKEVGGNCPDIRRIIHEAASLLEIDLSETMWAEAATDGQLSVPETEGDDQSKSN